MNTHWATLCLPNSWNAYYKFLTSHEVSYSVLIICSYQWYVIFLCIQSFLKQIFKNIQSRTDIYQGHVSKIELNSCSCYSELLSKFYDLNLFFPAYFLDLIKVLTPSATFCAFVLQDCFQRYFMYVFVCCVVHTMSFWEYSVPSGDCRHMEQRKLVGVISK